MRDKNEIYKNHKKGKVISILIATVIVINSITTLSIYAEPEKSKGYMIKSTAEGKPSERRFGYSLTDVGRVLSERQAFLKKYNKMLREGDLNKDTLDKNTAEGPGAEVGKLIDYNDLNKISNLSVDQFREGSGKKLAKEHAEAYIAAEQQFGVNAILLLGISSLESGHGTSAPAINEKNIFGYGRNKVAGHEWMPFESIDKCILFVAQRIKEDYLTKSGDYYVSPTLEGMNVHYCEEKTWAGSVKELCEEARKSLEKYLGGSEPGGNDASSSSGSGGGSGSGSGSSGGSGGGQQNSGGGGYKPKTPEEIKQIAKEAFPDSEELQKAAQEVLREDSSANALKSLKSLSEAYGKIGDTSDMTYYNYKGNCDLLNDKAAILKCEKEQNQRNRDDFSKEYQKAKEEKQKEKEKNKNGFKKLIENMKKPFIKKKPKK